jgi:hypothetical protein
MLLSTGILAMVATVRDRLLVLGCARAYVGNDRRSKKFDIVM